MKLCVYKDSLSVGRGMDEGAQAYCEERYSRESVLSEWERLLKRVAGE